MKIGYLFPAKKCNRPHIRAMLDDAETLNVSFVPVSIEDILSDHLDQFDAFLHKCSHLEPSVREQLEAKLSKCNIPIIEPFENVKVLIQRDLYQQVLENLQQNKFKVPKSIRLQQPCDPSQLALLRYPLLCKPVVGSGKARHDMLLLMTEKDLHMVQQLDDTSNSSYLFQEFKNHDGILYKGYVIGDHIEVFTRTSIPNLSSGTVGQSIIFDTQKPYPTFDVTLPTTPDTIPEFKYTQIQAIGQELSKVFHLGLFGYDIIECDDHYYVVDVNYFPSFKEVTQLNQHLRAYLLHQITA